MIKSLFLILIFSSNVQASLNNFVFTLDGNSLELTEEPYNAIINKEMPSLKQHVEQLSKIKVRYSFVDNFLDEYIGTNEYHGLKNTILKDFEESIRSLFVKNLNKHKYKKIVTNSITGYAVEDGISFLADLLITDDPVQKNTVKLFLSKYPRNHIEYNSIQLLFKLEQLKKDQTILLIRSEYSNKDFESIKKYIKHLGLRSRNINDYQVVGSGLSFDSLVNVLTQQSRFRNKEEITILNKLNKIGTINNITYKSEYLEHAIAYYLPEGSNQPHTVSFVIPEKADNEIYTHELTHYRFNNFKNKYFDWVKKKKYVVPFQINGYEGYLSFLNEINSWRIGSQFSQPLTDSTILSILKISYSEVLSVEDKKPFFNYWTEKKLKNKSIPKLIREETVKLNTMSSKELLRYGKLALESKNQIEQLNYILLLSKNNLPKTEVTKHKKLLKQYEELSVINNQDFNYLIKEINFLGKDMISRANKMSTNIFFENSNKSIKKFFSELDNTNVSSIHEAMMLVDQLDLNINKNALKDFLELLDFKNSEMLHDNLKSLSIKLINSSLSDFNIYFKITNDINMFYKYFYYNPNSDIVDTNKLIKSFNYIANYKGNLNSLQQFVTIFTDALLNAHFNSFEYSLRDIKIESDDLKRKIFVSEANNERLFNKKFDRFITKKINDIKSPNKQKMITNLILTFTTPNMLPEFKESLLNLIEYNINSYFPPALLKRFIEPTTHVNAVSNKRNLLWGEAIVNKILSLQPDRVNSKYYLLVSNFYRFNVNSFFQHYFSIENYQYNKTDRDDLNYKLKSNTDYEEYWLNRAINDLWPLLEHNNQHVRDSAVVTFVSNPAFIAYAENKLVDVLANPNSNPVLMEQVERILQHTSPGFLPEVDKLNIKIISPKLPELLPQQKNQRLCKLLFAA